MNEKPYIAVSRCLLGEKVRYDGESKPYPQLVAQLENEFNIIPVCPEVEIGLSVPRPPVQLVLINSEVRAQGREDSSLDITEDLTQFAQDFVKKHPKLAGLVLKSRSLSCGVGTTPVYPQLKLDDGLFAAGVAQFLQGIPMVNETALESKEALASFIDQVIQYATAQNKL